MTRDDKVVVDFPNADEERARRLRVEVERLAKLSHSEWIYYLSLPGMRRDPHLAVAAGSELRLEFRYGTRTCCNLNGRAGRCDRLRKFRLFGIRLRPGGMVISKPIGSQVPIEKL